MRNRYMINNMRHIEKFEKLVDNLEKYIPTPEYVKEQTNINVISITSKDVRAKKKIKKIPVICVQNGN